MAFSRLALCGTSLLRFLAVSPLTTSAAICLARPPFPTRSFVIHACLSIQTSTPVESPYLKKMNPWKPMCLYYTQGKCTKMDDPIHLDKFSHNCSWELETSFAESKHLCSQNLDFLLVLDLEGKVEVLEFPVLMVDANTMQVVDFFHRFVRPSKMSEQRLNEYVEGKYGKLGVDRVWHDTAIPFKQVLEEFEAWMAHHRLWGNEFPGALNRAAFVTCGNWDIKTKVPQQCKVSGMKLPSYFMEWINLKDVYLNFYKRRATGMATMLKELDLPLLGTHHLGIDDAKNIAKVLQRMLADGALMQITARRIPNDPQSVEFLFENRIR
ncbi:hypothetical protein Nepgr_026781 [Nepenthes gracilis]|uniref:Exonuclease domain-containing protein n=1 Tax=Nepenthes gracilis TaxID=150966 RepID=A0AAD3T938_NEPGR|nr:hypothetical protein Nepgr_026781 [Nepenthes gracilis]